MTADLCPLPAPEPGAAQRVSPVSRNMKSDLIDKAAKIIPHPPILINLVSRRVRQLNQGRAPLINTANYGPRLGQGDIALIEIIEGLISAEMLVSEEEA
jgi:DNA-directed RNA polymerase subunit omega